MCGFVVPTTRTRECSHSNKVRPLLLSDYLFVVQFKYSKKGSSLQKRVIYQAIYLIEALPELHVCEGEYGSCACEHMRVAYMKDKIFLLTASSYCNGNSLERENCIGKKIIICFV